MDTLKNWLVDKLSDWLNKKLEVWGIDAGTITAEKLMAGEVELTGMRFQDSGVLDRLGVPVKLAAGCIQKITVKIPWEALLKEKVLGRPNSEPVVVEVDGVFVCIRSVDKRPARDTLSLKHTALAAGTEATLS